jgi:hypothetical protein
MAATTGAPCSPDCSARRPDMDPRRLLTRLGLLCGIGGLVLQFSISMPAYLAAGRDIPGALGTFFAYFTILTNIAVVLVYLSEIFGARWLAPFRTPQWRGMMAACISLVSLYVYLVLRHLAVLEGLFLVADNLLHYVCPLLYLMWWLAGVRHGQLRWTNLPMMLVPTLVYFVYVMARGTWVQEYPYPILNAVKLGYAAVLFNAAGMTLALTALLALVIGLDQILGRQQGSAHD